jgi:DNA repair exonuclease SbcCD nuclease subunit
MTKTLKKGAMFTDIHFGAHNNSEQHNKDCINFINWFIDNVKNDPEIDHILFLGDYFEHRSAISGLTLSYAYQGASLLNDVGLPVYFITGNHDYFYRNTRDVHNTVMFDALNNFKVVNDITVMEELGERGAVITPFLFEHEFPDLLKYIEYPVVFGHLEFKDFVITGDSIVKEHGPDHKQFKNFKRIFSGHYHKRQEKDNVIYIGNTFPTSFADANDNERGMTVYTYKTNKVEYFNWPDAPMYIRCKLSALMASPKTILKENGTVNCFVDIELSYEESLELKSSFIKKYKLREFTLDEGFDPSISQDETEVVEDEEETVSQGLDEYIETKLKTVSAKNIDNNRLIKMYKGLQI